MNASYFSMIKLHAKKLKSRTETWWGRNEKTGRPERPTEALIDRCETMGFSTKTTRAMVEDGRILDRRLKELENDRD
jgi:hypothetical protein